MWYFICTLIFFVLEMACIITINKALSLQTTHRRYLFEDLADLSILTLIAILGALVWPLVVLIILSIVIFNYFLKEPFNKLAKWLSERL